jgi:hypothetical protein
VTDQPAPDSPPVTFTIGLPDQWFEIEVGADDVADRLHRLVVERFPADSEDRSELIRLVEAQLRTFVAQARSVDVALAAGFTELVVDDRDPADVGPDDDPYAGDDLAVLTATLLVSLHGSETAVTAEELGAAFSAGDAAASADRTVEVVQLPVGSAVLLKETRPEWFESAPEPGFFRFVQYLIPVQMGEGNAVLTFSTPSLPFVEDFEDVFAAIAETFELDLGT